MKRGNATKLRSRMVVAALLAATAMPAFARGQPELPSDDGGRASVLRELDPTRVSDDARSRTASASASASSNGGGNADRNTATWRVRASPSAQG
ncbi:hypothetical protein [Burkholderia ambifaria]|uniref:Uncharacterized protein n=1 Tax=Burkholderia ambifaria TaxID=152480 RepID=A0AA41E7V1_9BURK|nr:hypothetical protein [Burkholderia ambifaria]MBR8130112.1 hypothetical protein [Burkholderia ambifaria]PRE04577.1 hypothetical protein C6P77_02075 [Burkholderia ambifaria]